MALCELLNFSYFEEVFRKYLCSDFTITTVLNLSDSLAKCRIICVTYDDFHKFIAMSIYIKSWIIYLSIKHVNYSKRTEKLNIDDLQNVKKFLLDKIQFILVHLSDIENYFNAKSESRNLICSFRNQIKIIQKPISEGIDKKLNSYMESFLKEIYLFKNIFIDLFPPFENNFSNFFKAFVAVESDKNESTNDSQLTFNNMKTIIGKFTGSNQEYLSEIHKLCQKSEIEKIIKRSLKIKEWGSNGIEPNLVAEIQNSLSSYRKFLLFNDENNGDVVDDEVDENDELFLSKENKNEQELELTENHTENSSEPEEIKYDNNIIEIEDETASCKTNSNTKSMDIILSSKAVKRKLYSPSHSPSFLERSQVISTISDSPEPDNDKCLPFINSNKKFSKGNFKKKRKCFSYVPCANNETKIPEQICTRERNQSHGDDLSVASYSLCSSIRNQWRMDETLCIYKGVQQGLTWAAIKASYFKNSNRTNVNIKDRWRIILKKPELLKELEYLIKSEKK